MSGILGGLNSIVEKITSIPTLILDGIKSIFIPEEGYLEGKVEYLKEQFVRIGVAPYDMSAIMGNETALSNIDGTMFGQSVTFVNMEIVDEVVLHFKAVIRGFMWLMIVIYNFNQFMGLIGQQGITLGGIISTAMGKSQEEFPEQRALQQWYSWTK